MIPGAPHPFLMSGGHWESHHKIGHSVRNRRTANAYWSRVQVAPTSNQKVTFILWCRLCDLINYQFVISAGTLGNNEDWLRYNSDGTFSFQFEGVNTFISTRKFRDPAAHGMLMLGIDTTLATASQRVRLYWGDEEIALSGTVAQNYTFKSFNVTGMPINIGRRSFGASDHADMVFSEFRQVDGQQLVPADAGRRCPEKGHWEPTLYQLGYGANGSFLDFSDGSAATSAALGKDRSGNNNDWTPNNISVTAGASCDWMLDTPTNRYCALNALTTRANVPVTISDGALKVVAGPGGAGYGTLSVGSSGKWYWEVTATALGTSIYIGIDDGQSQGASGSYAGTVIYLANGMKLIGGSSSAYGAAFATSDVIGVAVDCDAGTIEFLKQTGGAGAFVSQGVIATAVTNRLPFTEVDTSATATVNFGQQPFNNNSIPAGHKALCAANEPEPLIVLPRKHVDAITYLGDGNTTKAVTGSQFQPDLVWAKNRTDAASDHSLHDTVRGPTQRVRSNSTAVENTEAMQSFDANGFTVLAAGSVLNVLNKAYVSWLWKAGGAPVANNAGSIAAQVSANVLSGFSIVTASLGAGSNQTIGHGLAAAPKLIIAKRRNGVGAWSIAFDHPGFTWASDYYQFDAVAKRTDGASNVWRQAPTSSVFSVGSSMPGDWVFYCFAEIPAYSKFGAYVGNGSADGAYVYCGFQPRYVLVKQSSPNATSWWIHDVARNTSNVVGDSLQADAANAESPGNLAFDFTSNGFKCRNNWSGNNTSGSNYIFAAFAEFPSRYANAR